MDEATKILALTESLLIWDYIAEHGCRKYTAIEHLYAAGAIWKADYLGGCPFCDCFARYGGCGVCLWPGISSGRCLGSRAYQKYERAESIKENQAAGRAMLRFLGGIEI